MSSLKLVGLAGSFNRPSKSKALVDTIAARAAERYGFSQTVYDLGDLGPSLGQANWPSQLDGQAQGVIDAILDADLLIVGTPTFKGSYPGMFKHLIDLIDPLALRGKPVILAATGGGERHALVVEHQLRPLLAFFQTFTLPTAIYAADREFTDYKVSAEHIDLRIEQAVQELAAIFSQRAIPQAIAAE
ncbi:FMN reductase [Limoniibacter endophyticus]|uniref:FMN reductase n=1 Tax=Limoniibacter endophyticus TaxID=1565040 RepID=A0A8J3DSM9_9HYPH|nr:FMN reductase [Limoniibacter endophyticus]GHC72751.1 FMN reductase [Limoniibacter endophyticus]